MSVPTLQITQPGMLTTVQDRGRYGYQRHGVPVSGAMDEFALRAANLLVGNEQGAAALEMTVVGPDVKVLTDTWIAVTGADLSPLLDGAAAPRWQAVEVRGGSLLSFGGMQDGMRAYLAVAGGIDVPRVMGSRSTYVKGGFGGFMGRALRKGDVIATMAEGPATATIPGSLPQGYRPPTYGEHHEIRVILGPRQHAFDSEAIATLLHSKYVISRDSDRMGYRLEGPPIQHKTGPDIISEGNPAGAVQVPGDGTPTVLLADRGTTGGYTTIATVITADMGRLAQAVPGQSVTFRSVTVAEAHHLLRETEAVLSALAGPAQAATQRLSILVDGQSFEVVDEAGHAISKPPSSTRPSSMRTHRAQVTIDGESFDFQVDVQRQERAGTHGQRSSTPWR